jgi:hypothetical protein
MSNRLESLRNTVRKIEGVSKPSTSMKKNERPQIPGQRQKFVPDFEPNPSFPETMEELMKALGNIEATSTTEDEKCDAVAKLCGLKNVDEWKKAMESASYRR